MGNLEALAFSMIENRQRKDTPTWMDIEYIGKIYENLYLTSHSEKIDEIVMMTGMSPQTIERYLNVYRLPDEVKGLLRSPEDRTKKQSEILLLYQSRASDKTLTIGNACCLSEIRNFDLENLMEITTFVLDLKTEITELLIDHLKMDPERSIDEIYNEIIKKVHGTHDKTIRFDNETWDAITKACMDKQMKYDRYLHKIIRERLNRDGYLGTNELIELELAEEEKDYVIVKCSKGLLENCGYKFLKTDSGHRVYQKPVRNGSGGFFKAFTKGYTTYLKLTPGNYSDEVALLKNEKRRLLENK